MDALTLALHRLSRPTKKRFVRLYQDGQHRAAYALLGSALEALPKQHALPAPPPPLPPLDWSQPYARVFGAIGEETDIQPGVWASQGGRGFRSDGSDIEGPPAPPKPRPVAKERADPPEPRRDEWWSVNAG